jgi:hypothetical protein
MLQKLLIILPLLVILVALLPPFRFHVLIAGLLGGVTAVIVGGVNAGDVTKLFFEGLGQILDIKSVMLFAATAMVLAKCGCTNAIMRLITKWFGDKTELVAASMVLVQAMATYMAGIGAANTLVTAPLMFAAVGFVPLAVVGMSIVSGATWATSPSSAESAYISSQMKISAAEYASYMLPYTLAFWVLGAALAWYGVRRYRLAGKLVVPSAETASAATLQHTGDSNVSDDISDVRRAIPFFVMLAIILVGPPLNRIIGTPLFSPVLVPLWVLAIAAITLKVNPNKLGELFVDGGLTILRYMFLVGLFLGFIKILGKIGTFEAIASVVGTVPVSIVTVAGLAVAFLIAIPAAAYTVAIDALIIPVLGSLGVPVWAFGFVGIAVAQGAMMSPVQINVAATAHGFQKDILEIVRTNAPYLPAVFVVTVLMTMFLAVP